MSLLKILKRKRKKKERFVIVHVPWKDYEPENMYKMFNYKITSSLKFPLGKATFIDAIK